MKKTLQLILLSLIATVVLSACGNTPIQVGLQDFTVDASAVANTAGKVVYKAEPVSFEKPVINVKTVKLSGNVTPSYLGTTLQIQFYASASKPVGCDEVAGLLVCDKNGQKPISGEYTLENGVKQPIELGNPNADVLAEGLNNGKIWLGVEIASSGAANVKLQFSDMVASVTIF